MIRRGREFQGAARKALAGASITLLALSSTMFGVRANAPGAPEAAAPATHQERIVAAPPPPVATRPHRAQPAQHTQVLAEPSCGTQHETPGIGPSCTTPNGLERVSISDGTTVDTHGGDPITELSLLAGKKASGPLDIFGTAIPVPCAADAARDHTFRAIYAVPSDRADRSKSILPSLRDTVERANGAVRAEAPTSIAGLRFVCSGAQVSIARVVLPTTSARTTFSTVVGDLRAAGYRSTTQKYVVFLDMNLACGCAGLGTFHADDRPAVDNVSNTGPDYAVIMQLAFEMPMVVLHEAAHTLGAVQLTARDSSGAGHCNDGYDVMCYDDGGPRAAYRTSACVTIRFDCAHNDYFDPDPAPGSYLATHWNLASRFDRYLVFRGINHRPEVRGLACDLNPSESTESVRCSFSLSDDSPALSYVVDWGDGNKTTADDIATDGPFSVSHTWSDDGVFAVRVTASDEALSSVPAVLVHRVATCALSRSGTIVLGLQGVTIVDGVNSVMLPGVAPGCAGYNFVLTTDSASGIDICWLNGTETLSCTKSHAARITGFVPGGATAARLDLYSGLNSSYALRAPVRRA